MAAWRQLSIPYVCERMIGFSVPQDGAVVVVSYEGMHLVRLGPQVTVETDGKHKEYDLYDHRSGVCRYLRKRWTILGLYPGRPLLTGREGERLLLDRRAQTVSVLEGDRVAWWSSYSDLSGDWAAATFSPDGRFIVLGCPYGFDFRVFERVQGHDAQGA